VVLIGTALALAGAGLPEWIGLAAFAVHLHWHIRRLEIDKPAQSLTLFKFNPVPATQSVPIFIQKCIVDYARKAIPVDRDHHHPEAFTTGDQLDDVISR
jgi:hypothetical protein